MHRWSGHTAHPAQQGAWPGPERQDYAGHHYEQQEPRYQSYGQPSQSQAVPHRPWPDPGTHATGQYQRQYGSQQYASDAYGASAPYSHGVGRQQDYRGHSDQPVRSTGIPSVDHRGDRYDVHGYSGGHNQPYDSRSKQYGTYQPDSRDHQYTSYQHDRGNQPYSSYQHDTHSERYNGHQPDSHRQQYAPDYDNRRYDPPTHAPPHGRSMPAHGGGYQPYVAPTRSRVGSALPPHPSMQQHGARHATASLPHDGAPSRPYTARHEGTAGGTRGQGAAPKQQSIPYTGRGRDTPGSQQHGGRSPRKQGRTDNKRARTAPGTKPSWWVPPDMSQGFASTEGKVKLDLLPAQQPALLPKPGTTPTPTPAATTTANGAEALPAETTGTQDAGSLATATTATVEPPGNTASEPAVHTTTEQPEAAAIEALTGSTAAVQLLDATTEPEADDAVNADSDTPAPAAVAGDTTIDVEGANTNEAVQSVDVSVNLGPAGSDAAVSREQLPILLFDLNGTLTSHTHQRQSSGITKVRPGVEALARLAHKCRIGIFSSASHRTVSTARALIEEATGYRPLFEPGLIMHREHTTPAPQAAGKAWDTAKPLGKWFDRLERVILLDDDGHKSLAEERSSLLLVPAWREEDQECTVINELANALDEVLSQLTPNDDVRLHVPAIETRLRAAAGIPAQQEESADNNNNVREGEEEEGDDEEDEEAAAEAEEQRDNTQENGGGSAAVEVPEDAPMAETGERGADAEAVNPVRDELGKNI